MLLLTLQWVAGGDKDGEVDDNGVDERCGGDAGRWDDGGRGGGAVHSVVGMAKVKIESCGMLQQNPLLVVLATSSWKMTEGFFLAIYSSSCAAS
jgi:hypothetical protein